MKITLCVCAVLALVLGAATATNYGQVSAMTGSSACTLRLYTALPENTEIVFTGSSRVRRGIETDVITAELGLPATGAVNLAHPAPSVPLDLALLKRLTEDTAPKVLVAGVIVRSAALTRAERAIDPRRSMPFDFSLSTGSIKQIYLLGAPWSEQVDLLGETISNPFLTAWESTRLYAERMRQFIPAVLSKSVLLRPIRNTTGYEPDRLQDCRNPDWVDPSPTAQNGSPEAVELKAQYHETFATFEDPTPLGYFNDPSLKLEHAALTELIALAENLGAQIAFLYIPGIDVPVDPTLAANFETTFGAPLWVPDDALRKSLADGGYFDNSHLNTAGRTLFSTWVAEQAAPLLKKAGS